MRRIGVVTCLLGGLLLGQTAMADMADDCEQTVDWYLKIQGCTQVIDSGEWSGSALSWAYSNRALAYQHLGDNNRALAEIDQALELEPTAYQTLNIRGNLRARLGNTDGADRDWTRSFELGGADYVRTFQDWLKYHGYFSGPIDGVYGRAMRDAMFACSKDLDC